jgi:hypothetical protein
MSLRADTTQLISGALVASKYPGHGIFGSAIITNGSMGYGSLISQAYPTFSSSSEYRLLIVSKPSTATINEDGSGFDAPPGGVAVLRMYEDGIELP